MDIREYYPNPIDITFREIKDFVFDAKERRCCNCWYCGLEDGYCPKYDCGLLDKLKALSDRQWRNVIRQCLKENDFEISNIVGIALKKVRSSK